MKAFILISVFFSLQAFAETDSCPQAHSEAVKKCTSYEGSIEVDQLEQVGPATRKRMAEKESLKLYSLGRSCAKAQEACVSACEGAFSQIEDSGDMTQFIEYQNDCAQGSIANHRSNLAKRYLGMKDLADSTRDPASAD